MHFVFRTLILLSTKIFWYEKVNRLWICSLKSHCGVNWVTHQWSSALLMASQQNKQDTKTHFQSILLSEIKLRPGLASSVSKISWVRWRQWEKTRGMTNGPTSKSGDWQGTNKSITTYWGCLGLGEVSLQFSASEKQWIPGLYITKTRLLGYLIMRSGLALCLQISCLWKLLLSHPHHIHYLSQAFSCIFSECWHTAAIV